MPLSFTRGLVVALALVLPSAAEAQAPRAASDSAAVAAVLGAFHAALAAGDGPAALALMTDDARILEGGGVETRSEYADHHLPADMAFAAAVDRESGPVEVFVRGDVAWAASTSRAVGTWGERQIDSRGAELAVMARHADGWRIAAIHWSSR